MTPATEMERESDYLLLYALLAILGIAVAASALTIILILLD